MRHPAATLSLIQRKDFSVRGKRIALLGTNEYIKAAFRKILFSYSSAIEELEVDETQLRASLLRLRDITLTSPFQWEQPLIWVTAAQHLFASLSFPDDFPQSDHIIVCCSDVDSVYVPSSFIPVQIDSKGGALQDFIRWMMQQKGLTSEIDVIRFLSSEYKDDLPAVDKLLDHLYLKIHPRSVLMEKDLESGDHLEWDCNLIIRSMVEGDEQKALSEVQKALITFHPKGIITVLARRITLLITISASVLTSTGSPDDSEIKPWVWRQNAELLKMIPNERLFKWSIALDRAYALLSRGSVSYRWTLYNTMLEMCRAS